MAQNLLRNSPPGGCLWRDAGVPLCTGHLDACQLSLVGPRVLTKHLRPPLPEVIREGLEAGEHPSAF